MDTWFAFDGGSIYQVLLLALMALIAGFIDSVAGGGGMIQVPALLINLPDSPMPVLFGTNKIAAISGTTVAAWQYSTRVKYQPVLLGVFSLVAFLSSRFGAFMLYYIHASVLKPVILMILILIALFTFLNRKTGLQPSTPPPFKVQMIRGSMISIAVGVYDGFFGPGTGTFLVLGFVTLLGFDFLTATAYAKVVNCITNLSALIVFVVRGDFIPELAIIMAVSNITGSIIGSRMALKRGNEFIRVVFMVVVVVMILKYGYEVILK